MPAQAQAPAVVVREAMVWSKGKDGGVGGGRGSSVALRGVDVGERGS
jgi:hypothetical protein